MRSKVVVAIAFLVAVTVVGGCTSSSGSTSTAGGDPTSTTAPDAFGCVSAPVDLRHSYSEFPLSLDENPVVAGSTTTIRIGSMVTLDQYPELEDWGDTEFAARWECWTGSEWVGTHLLVYNGETVGGGDPTVDTTFLAYIQFLPNAFDIIIPDVRAGWYRLVAEAKRPKQTGEDQGVGRFVEGFGYIAVEVIE